MKRVIRLLSLLLIACLLTGCGSGDAPKEKVVTCDGLTMSVPVYYQDLAEQGYYSDFDFAFGYGETVVLGEHVPLSMLEGWEPTLAEFARNFTYVNGLNAKVTDRDGILTVYYEIQEDILWAYLAAFYAYDGGFWIVQYSCPAETFPDLDLEFLQSLGTVTIS